MFAKSIEVTELSAFLVKRFSETDFVSYSEMSDFMKCNILKRRHYIAGAVKTLLRDSRIVVGTRRGEGLEKLDNVRVSQVGSVSLERMKREANRGIDRVSAVDYDSLTKEQQAKMNAQTAALCTARFLCKEKNLDKIELSENLRPERMNPEEVLKLFKDKVSK